MLVVFWKRKGNEAESGSFGRAFTGLEAAVLDYTDRASSANYGVFVVGERHQPLQVRFGRIQQESGVKDQTWLARQAPAEFEPGLLLSHLRKLAKVGEKGSEVVQLRPLLVEFFIAKYVYERLDFGRKKFVSFLAPLEGSRQIRKDHARGICQFVVRVHDHAAARFYHAQFGRWEPGYQTVIGGKVHEDQAGVFRYWVLKIFQQQTHIFHNRRMIG